MILLVAFFIMWSISLLFLFMRSKEKTNLWFSGLFFVQGLGVLEAIVEVLIIPRILENVQVFWVIRRFLATFCFRFFPYCLIMAGVSYADYFNFKMKRRLKFLFLIPIIITFILDFVFAKDGFLYTDLPQSRNYWMTHIWAVPYYLFSNYLFFQTYYVESEKQKKQQKFLVFIALALPTLMIMTGTLTIAPNNNWWKYLLVQSFLLTGVFLYFIGRYGLDGLRIRLEREYRNGTISGATIMSHTIKNELSKIHCNIEAVKSGLCNADRALYNIDMAAEHMYEIVDHIGRHLREFSLICSNHSLTAIIDPLLASHENIFKEKNIHIVKSYNADPVIYCDKAHITEVLNNIIINAIEAITADNGRIFVELSSNKRQAVIKISDNGVGIPMDKLALVSNLFYSTKGEGTAIRGSGLYYCAAVIERHHGELKISSELDIGTTVDIILPFSRVTKKFA
jgi:signal transduction histidine kinase